MTAPERIRAALEQMKALCARLAAESGKMTFEECAFEMLAMARVTIPAAVAAIERLLDDLDDCCHRRSDDFPGDYDDTVEAVADILAGKEGGEQSCGD